MGQLLNGCSKISSLDSLKLFINIKHGRITIEHFQYVMNIALDQVDFIHFYIDHLKNCCLCSVIVKDVENALISTLGSDMTEQACEASCPAVVGTIPGGSLVAGVLCPQACKR